MRFIVEYMIYHHFSFLKSKTYCEIEAAIKQPCAPPRIFVGGEAGEGEKAPPSDISRKRFGAGRGIFAQPFKFVLQPPLAPNRTLSAGIFSSYFLLLIVRCMKIYNIIPLHFKFL